MPIVKINPKFQVTLPVQTRREIPVKVGDLLEVTIEKGRYVLSPKTLIDRRLAAALEDAKKGRLHGPFYSTEELIRHLHSHVKAVKRRRHRP